MKYFFITALFLLSHFSGLPAWARADEVLYFANGNIKRHTLFKGPQVIERRHYDNQGTLTVRYFYETLSRSLIRISVKPQDPDFILSKEEWMNLNEDFERSEQSRLVRSWVYKDNILLAVEEYDSQGRVQAKSLIKNNQPVSRLYYYYRANEKDASAFRETDMKGKPIAGYRLYEAYNRTHHLKKSFNAQQIDFILKTHAQSPLKIAIIDSGFDYNHQHLAHKFYQNPLEKPNNQDDDQNGWIDDIIGWDQKSNTSLPAEITTALQKELRPLSHGTHVADIATHSLENVQLIGFGGDYTQSSYIDKISTYLRQHKVQVVNMSIGIPPDPKNDMGLRDAARAYERLVRDNPETLFVVAAGNSGLNLDEFKNRQFPANIQAANLITVGSADINRSESSTTPPAISSFSNWGQVVHVFAPGKNIEAASLGGGVIAHSGTSMASPAVAHLALEILNIDPSLKPEQIKELLLKTTSEMAASERVSQQGVINRSRALFEARLQKTQNFKPVKNGPNCWNSSLFMAGLNRGLYYTDDAAFRKIIDSPLCKEISRQELSQGDIIALRRYAQGKILPASFLSEVHASTYISGEQVLSKNGPAKNAPYELSTISEVYDSYKRQESRNCKIYGLNKAQCDLQMRFYRCQELTSQSPDVYTQALMRKLHQIESLNEEQFRSGSGIPHQAISELRRELTISEISSWLKSHYETVLQTIENVL